MTRILLVEDSTDILFLLQTELEWMGYTVDVASDAVTGLQLARKNRPKAIVSDLHMPDVDGFEFIADQEDSGTQSSCRNRADRLQPG